jgi:hypothetical protein
MRRRQLIKLFGGAEPLGRLQRARRSRAGFIASVICTSVHATRRGIPLCSFTDTIIRVGLNYQFH